ncbi:MAG: ArnT family glycosyltransferase [Rudaea sp.]
MRSDHPVTTLVLWIAGMTLGGLALARPATERGSRVAPIDRGMIVALTAAALAARLFELSYRPLFGGDEGNWGAVARAFLHDGGNPFGFGFLGFPALGEYVTAIALAIGGDTIAAVRTPAAVAGALTALVVTWYGVARWGRVAGVCAGFVVATLPLHVHLSRQGLPNVVDALLVALGMFALEAAWARKRDAGFVVAGAALGMAQYVYTSARAGPIIAAAWIALRLAVPGKDAMQRARGLLALLFVFALAVVPQALRVAADPAAWLAPIARRSDVPLLWAGIAHDPVAGTVVVLDRVAAAAGAFVFVPLRGLMVPAIPLLPAAYATAFLVGLLVVLRRWRDPRAQLLLVWLAVVLAMATVSESTPAGQRYAIAVPAAAIVTGIGVDGVAKLAARAGIGARMIVVALVALLFVTQAAVALHHYFTEPKRWVSGGREPSTELAADLAARIDAAPPGTRVAMLGAPRVWYHGLGQLAFLHPATLARDVEATEDAAAAVATICRDGARRAEPHLDCLVVVLPHRAADIPRIRARLPVSRETAVDAPDGLPLYTLLEACAYCAPSPHQAGAKEPASVAGGTR